MLVTKSRLKVLLAEADITQAELAEKLNINRRFIIDLANGKSKSLSVENLKKMVEFFQCNIQDLIYFEKVS